MFSGSSLTTFADKHLSSDYSLISDFILLVLLAVICIPLHNGIFEKREAKPKVRPTKITERNNKITQFL